MDIAKNIEKHDQTNRHDMRDMISNLCESVCPWGCFSISITRTGEFSIWALPNDQSNHSCGCGSQRCRPCDSTLEHLGPWDWPQWCQVACWSDILPKPYKFIGSMKKGCWDTLGSIEIAHWPCRQPCIVFSVSGRIHIVKGLVEEHPFFGLLLSSHV